MISDRIRFEAIWSPDFTSFSYRKNFLRKSHRGKLVHELKLIPLTRKARWRITNRYRLLANAFYYGLTPDPHSASFLKHVTTSNKLTKADWQYAHLIDRRINA
jgi:L-rhamnose isomerase